MTTSYISSYQLHNPFDPEGEEEQTLCVCVCVRERERERVCVCVFVRPVVRVREWYLCDTGFFVCIKDDVEKLLLFFVKSLGDPWTLSNTDVSLSCPTHLHHGRWGGRWSFM